MLIKLEILVQMRSIITVIGDRHGKYLLGTVGLYGTWRGPECVSRIVVPAETLQFFEHLVSLADLELGVHPKDKK